MSQTFSTQAGTLRNSPRFQAAKKEILEAILSECKKLDQVKPASNSSDVKEAYAKEIKEFGALRGRDLYFPFIGSGLGRGPLVELLDGSVKYDMITGIGVNFFGHTHPALMDEIIEGIAGDVMQGNLEPAVEMKALLQAILSRVGEGCRLKHGWLMGSGTMCNEVALKIIRQKKTPSTKILAFKDCFAGRSTAMQEITDNPSYRQGQPTYGEVHYLPFYDPYQGVIPSIEQTLNAMRELLTRYPHGFAALMIELVQGEGGFRHAPRDYYAGVFEEAKKEGLAIWVDEVQTFGRTGELFAYQKFKLNEYVDVVTVGKMLQACMVLYTEEYNPKPGLVAGTFSGSTAALRTARRILELMEEEKLLGPEGKIEKLSTYFVENLNKLASGSCKGLISEVRAVGGMIAFAPLYGKADEVKTVLMRLFELGVIAFNCGHGPYLVRLLPPFGVMSENDVDQVCGIIEAALLEVAERRKE